MFGGGVGRLLLAEALRKAVVAGESVVARLVVIDSIDDANGVGARVKRGRLVGSALGYGDGSGVVGYYPIGIQGRRSCPTVGSA